MSSFSRRAIALFTVVTCALLLPGAYSAADEEDPGAGAPSAEASPSPEPTPEPAASATPSDPAPSPSPSEASPEPSPSPDPTPTPSPSASPDARRTPAGEEESSLHLSLGASPATIDIGEETTVGVVLTNPNDEPAEGVDLIVTLPKELGFVSSDPSPDSVSVRGGKTTAVFGGLTVPARGSLTIAVFAEGLEETTSPATIEGAAVWQDFEPTDTASVNVVVPDSDLGLSTTGPALLTTVGETVVYQVTLRNNSDAPVSDVSIVNLVPSEIHVTGAGLAPGIDAVQVGSSGNAEDVVWAITEMDPGEVIRVSYQGVVETPGDLEALNRTRALTAGAEVAETSERNYLASSGGGGSHSPSFDPIVERTVTREKVVERPLIRRRLPTEPGGVSTTAPLPYSGLDPWGIAAVGILLIGLGGLLLYFGARGADRRRLLAVAFLVLLVGGACMSSDSDPKTAGPSPSATPSDDTRVKGKEIFRDGNGGNGPNATPPGDDDPNGQPGDDGDTGDVDPPVDGDPDDGSDEDESPVVTEPDEPDTEVVLVPGPRVTTFEKQVTTTTLTEDELGIQQVASIDDASPASFTWNDGGGVGGGTASSLHSDVVEMTTVVEAAGEGMRATVTLANIAERAKLEVAGRLDLRIAGGGGGSIATLAGSGVDTVLNPDGETSAQFIFRLPSGSYSAQGIFKAD